jgi:hypothetical protein
VIRYNADGSPDYIFNGGKVTIGFGGDDRANDMACFRIPAMRENR